MSVFLELTSPEKGKILLNLDKIVAIYSGKNSTGISVIDNTRHIAVIETLEEIKQKINGY